MSAPPDQMTEFTKFPSLPPEIFKRIARLVHSESGIRLGEGKHSLVVSRLSRRLRSLGIGNFADYCSLVESVEGAPERMQMISSLTTNVTRFFREGHHFALLREKLLPPLVARARQGQRVRLWSAGCSTGEEPYSLALTLLEICPEIRKLDLRILASDIDSHVVARAQEGRYGTQALDAVPLALRHRYFQKAAPNSDQFELADEVRSLVAFRELNLLADWPFSGQFDIVLCRNVVIYFDAETQEQLWSRMAKVIGHGGFLLIGHSERLSSSSQGEFKNIGVTSYIRKCGKYHDSDGSISSSGKSPENRAGGNQCRVKNPANTTRAMG